MHLLPSVTTKCMYDIFRRKKCITLTYIHKWNETHQRQEAEWADIFTRTFKVVRETKLQSFQLKLVHRILNCNKKIFYMKIKASPQCSYCDGIDDISHFFFHCPTVQHLCFFVLRNVEYEDVNFPYYPNVYDILFGVSSMNGGHKVLNFCILHVKYYIYKQRLFNENTMSLREIRNDIRYKLDIEKKICANEDKQVDYEKYIPLYNKLSKL